MKHDLKNQKLLLYFLDDPVWDYEKKIRIAQEIGMTYN